MSGSSKFSVILLHDDGRTHRMRMSHGMLRLMIAGLVVAPTLGALGLWAGFEGWRSLRAWQSEKAVFQNRVDALQVQVERLSALEALLEQRQAGAPALAAAESAASDSASEAGGDAAAPSVQTASPVRETPKETPPVVVAEEDAEQRKVVNTGVIRVENLRAALVDRQRLRAGADMYAVNSNGRQLGGRAVFSLRAEDGRRFPLVNEDAAFRISRFKKVVTLSPLPLPAADLKNAMLVLEVTVGDRLVYRNFCPVEER